MSIIQESLGSEYVPLETENTFKESISFSRDIIQDNFEEDKKDSKEENGIDLKKNNDIGRAKIKRHLIQSKQRLAKLDKKFKTLDERNKSSTKKKKIELPLHLQNGAHNNFKVDESMKSCWYDRVAESYIIKRRTYKIDKCISGQDSQRKNRKDRVKVQCSILENVRDAPIMSSLDTMIQMKDETLYYFTKYEQEFNTEKNNRQDRQKQMTDQIARTKEITMHALIRNGLNVLHVPSDMDDEPVLINIREEDEIAEDEKEKGHQRKRSFISRKSNAGSLKDEKIITRRSFVLNNGITTGSRTSVDDDEIADLNMNSSQNGNLSHNLMTNLNAGIRRISLRNPSIFENVEKEEYININLAESLDSILTTDIGDISYHIDEIEKPKSKKILEPLTWDEMVEIDKPKLTIPEKVPIMKWHNPK